MAMRHYGWAAVLVLVLAGPVAAQTSDDFFNPEVLQRVELWMNSKDWEKLKQNFEENTYYPADVVWGGQTVRNVGIRSRGLGSRSATKPGLRVDMDRYATDQTFLGLKSFVLDNLTQDASGVKETMTMRFFARLGIPASRETHTRLYVNGEYAGLYALIESVDKTMLARVYGKIGDDTQNDGYLFEYKYQRRVALAVPVPGAVARPLQGVLRREDPRGQERHEEVGADRGGQPARERHAGGELRGDRQPEARPHQVHPVHGRAELRGGKRRLPRLRRDEQLLFLPSGEQRPARVHRVGRGQRVPEPGLPDQHAPRRERPDVEDDGARQVSSRCTTRPSRSRPRRPPTATGCRTRCSASWT